MHTKLSVRLLAAALAICALLGAISVASAASIADGSKTATISAGENQNYLPTAKGNFLKAAGYTYTTNDGLVGPAYCIDYGLMNTNKVLPIKGKYTSHPATAGVFANGYPQHTLATFLELFLASNPVLEGLSENEYMYATQVAVWASLGQLGVEGTAFTAGRNTIPQPSGDLRQMRVFRAVQLILFAAQSWTRVYQTGMYIRTEQSRLGGNITIPANMTLEAAAIAGLYGFKVEAIGGKSYYTHEYIFASATSSYYNDYTLELWADGAPAGTIFTDTSNRELPKSSWHETQTWRLPVSETSTALNDNGSEYSGRAKLCIPTENVPTRGEINIRCAAQIMQYEIYLAYNDVASQQSYIIADPSKGSMDAEALLSWGSEMTEVGSLRISKVGGGGLPLEGAEFTLAGTDGSSRKGKTNAKGMLEWNGLDPRVRYTLSETNPPAGYSAVEPMDITIRAGHIEHVTIKDDAQHTLIVRKIDAQTGYSLRGAVIAFEQIDGSFSTTATTDHAGTITLNADELPIGSYRVYEKTAPAGYLASDETKTIHWDAKRDMTLTFEDVRKPTLIIAKRDARTHYSLEGAVFEVYRDGRRVTTVTSGADGCAYVHDVSAGYYEVREVTAPMGYIADSALHGITIDPYDPATTDDPMLVIENDPNPALHIVKLDGITKDPIKGAKFRVVYASSNTFTGEINDLGSFYTDEHGRIDIPDLKDGWYRITETAAAAGYALAEPASQEVFIKAGEDKIVTFENRPLGALVIHKVDAVSGKSLGGARFRLRYLHATSGTGGTVIGEYDTSANGTAVITGLAAGTYVVEEVRAPQGYAISDAPKTVYLSGDEQAVVTVEFADEPNSGLIVLKLDSDMRKPLSGAVFEIRSADGAVVGTSGGRYTTDASGRIHLPNLPADTYIVREVQAPRGYLADGEAQTVLLEHGKTHTLTFYNTRIPEGGLRVLKLDEHTGQPIEGVRFTIYHMDGRTVGSYRTNRSGVISLDGLTPGWYTVVETRAADGYEQDATPHDIEVRAGATATIEVTNRRTSSIVIRKVDSTTGAGLSGATFVLYDGRDNPIGEYRSDQRGYVYIDGLEDGRYSLREIEAPSGYVIDSERKTVYVRYGASSEVRWENTPMTGQIQIVKRSADYCETTGLSAGSPLEGAVFEVYAERTGNLADTVRSGENGLAVTKQLPLGRYVVREASAPNGYLTSDATVTAVLEYSGQIVRLEAENESVRTGVEIVKTGAKEIVSGQPMRYVLRSIANTSNVALDSFYWRDTLPAGVTADRLVTGRYDGSGSYKVLYRVGDGEYRVLADNLSAERSYTLSLSPATLGLAANERITEIMLVFGRVPSGFHATETPMIYCTASKGLAAGASITNSADVGGMYGGKWVQAVSRWTTAVYGKPEPLPRTGY